MGINFSEKSNKRDLSLEAGEVISEVSSIITVLGDYILLFQPKWVPLGVKVVEYGMAHKVLIETKKHPIVIHVPIRLTKHDIEIREDYYIRVKFYADEN